MSKKNLPTGRSDEVISDEDFITLSECPSCGSQKIVPFHTGQYKNLKIFHQFCNDCALVFMNPRPTQTWYNQLYAADFWEEKSSSSGHDVKKNRRQWEIALRRGQKYVKFLQKNGHAPQHGGKLVEIGCAYGVISRRVSETFGLKAHGVEPSLAARSIAQEKLGVEMLGTTFEDFENNSNGQKFDLFIFSHVLENIVDLESVFKHVRNSLTENGKVLIETPNVFFPRAAHIYHPYVFSSNGLSKMLEKNGFEILDIQISGAPRATFSPQYITLLAQAAHPNSSKISDNLIGKLFRKKFWLKCGNMWHKFSRRAPLNRIDGRISRPFLLLDKTSQKLLKLLEQ